MEAASLPTQRPSTISGDGTINCPPTNANELFIQAAASADGQLETNTPVDGRGKYQESKGDEEQNAPEQFECSLEPHQESKGAEEEPAPEQFDNSLEIYSCVASTSHGAETKLGSTHLDDPIGVAEMNCTTGVADRLLLRLHSSNNLDLDLELGLNGSQGNLELCSSAEERVGGAQGNAGIAGGSSEDWAARHAGGVQNPWENSDLEKAMNGKQGEGQTRSKVFERGKAGALEKQGQTSKNGEKACRVCHLGLDSQLGTAVIELGCSCKDELAVAHRSCAEAWFKIKGNRTCEICGSTVRNVLGVGDAAFMENWNDRNASTAVAEETRCWQNHRLFNFLLACMVLAFVIPWLFHVNPVFSWT